MDKRQSSHPSLFSIRGAGLFLWLCTHLEDKASSFHDVCMTDTVGQHRLSVERHFLYIHVFIALVRRFYGESIAILQPDSGLFYRRTSQYILVRAGTHRIKTKRGEN